METELDHRYFKPFSFLIENSECRPDFIEEEAAMRWFEEPLSPNCQPSCGERNAKRLENTSEWCTTLKNRAHRPDGGRYNSAGEHHSLSETLYGVQLVERW